MFRQRPRFRSRSLQRRVECGSHGHLVLVAHQQTEFPVAQDFAWPMWTIHRDDACTEGQCFCDRKTKTLVNRTMREHITITIKRVRILLPARKIDIASNAEFGDELLQPSAVLSFADNDQPCRPLLPEPMKRPYQHREILLVMLKAPRTDDYRHPPRTFQPAMQRRLGLCP